MASGEFPAVFVANGWQRRGAFKNWRDNLTTHAPALVHPASHHVVGLPWCTQDILWRSLGVARIPRGSVEAALKVAALAVATCGGMGGGGGGIGWALQIRDMNGWAVGGFLWELGGWPVTWHASHLLLRASCRAYNNVVEAMVEPLLSPCLCSRPAGSPSLWSAKVPSKFQLPGSAFKLQASHKVTPARVVRGH